MKIFFDSTALKRDYFLSSPDARLLESFVSKTHSSVVVSRIVLDEVENLYREDLSEVGEKLSSKYRQLLAINPPQLPKIDISRECKAYRNKIECDLKDRFRGVVLPYPEVSHEELVRRDLARRKPFNPAGRGYRDALIWRSILTNLSSISEAAALISNNTKDFWSNDGKHVHEDLAEDMRAAKIRCELRIFTGIDEFNRAIVIPTFERLESAIVQLREKGAFSGLDLKELTDSYVNVRQLLKEEKTLHRLIREQVGRGNFEDATLDAVGKPYAIRIEDVFELDGAKIFLRFTAAFDITAEVLIPSGETHGWGSFSAPWVTRLGDSEDSPCLIDVELTAYFSVTAIYNVAEERLETIDVEPSF